MFSIFKNILIAYCSTTSLVGLSHSSYKLKYNTLSKTDMSRGDKFYFTIFCFVSGPFIPMHHWSNLGYYTFMYKHEKKYRTKLYI